MTCSQDAVTTGHDGSSLRFCSPEGILRFVCCSMTALYIVFVCTMHVFRFVRFVFSDGLPEWSGGR